jgi:choline monooxygenase
MPNPEQRAYGRSFESGGPGVHDVPTPDCSQKVFFAVASHVWMHMVFINLSGNAEPFETYIAPLEQRWARFTGPDGLAEARSTTTHLRMESTLACSWKLAVENYCESYHLAWMHPGLNSYYRIEDHCNILAGDW